MKTFDCHIAPETPSCRLDMWLARRYAYFSRAQWKTLIEAGRVRLDGRPCEPASRVRGGQRLSYRPLEGIEPEIARDYAVLYEDAALLLVNKPAPCPTTRTGVYLRHTLEHLIEQHLGGRVGVDFWMLHRLDIETSGVVMIAKTRAAADRCYADLAAHRIEKSYVCVTQGAAPILHHFQELPIGYHPAEKVRIRSRVLFDPALAKPALTFFHTLASKGGYHYVYCRLYTGRTNQIRVHLEALGHWILGDKLYHPNPDIGLRYVERRLGPAEIKALGSPRMLLHARAIRLRHPVSGRVLSVSAPLKPDMQKYLKIFS